MFELNEVVRGRLIDPKSWDRLVGFMEPKFTARDFSRTVWVSKGVIHAMDCIVVCIRSKMSMKCRFTK